MCKTHPFDETPKTIYKWAKDTFGDKGVNPLTVGIRMNHEMSELLSALEEGTDVSAILFECADIRIMLAQIECAYGVTDSQEFVNTKMMLNRKRSWANINGKMQHVDETP